MHMLVDFLAVSLQNKLKQEMCQHAHEHMCHAAAMFPNLPGACAQIGNGVMSLMIMA